jgi:hypothetical protein
MANKLSDGKAIKTSRWVSNMVFQSDDANFLSEAIYQNFIDQLREKASQLSVDEALSGLELIFSATLSSTLKVGEAISFSGTYLEDGSWGFQADTDQAFGVVVPEDTTITVDAGGTSDRVDILEIRPVQNTYNLVSRKYKDPITGAIVSANTNTRLEYGFESQIKKGTEGTIAKETWTWTVSAATTGSDLDGLYLLFSTYNEDYYVWFDTGSSTDPAVSSRTGIQVSIGGADNYTTIATKLEAALTLYFEADTFDYVPVKFEIDSDEVTGILEDYANVTDASNGDASSYFDTISVTDGLGPQETTAGWIKIAEIYVAASASSIDQDDIIDSRFSYRWKLQKGSTIAPRNQTDIGLVNEALEKFFETHYRVPFQLSASVVTKGTGDTLDITAFTALLGYRGRVYLCNVAAQDDLAVSDAVLDGATTNYVKLKYKPNSSPDNNWEFVVDDKDKFDNSELVIATFTGTTGSFTITDIDPIEKHNIFVSSSAPPSSGNEGDIWMQYSP